MNQLPLFISGPKGQLLKWIGSKHKYARAIISYFPTDFYKYVEPFVGSGAILAAMSPKEAIAGDILEPLIDFWRLVIENPESLAQYYSKTIERFNRNRDTVYREILNKYNESPNPHDLLILSRTCYAGVVRFTKQGKMSTPIGAHTPISPLTFSARLDEWRGLIKNTLFLCQPFAVTMEKVEKGDLVYCDPPYIESQTILYGAQDFRFKDLIDEIKRCSELGAKVALSIAGTKKSGRKAVNLNIQSGIFKREIYLNCGSSMLKRFQANGQSMSGEEVRDRLLLTW